MQNCKTKFLFKLFFTFVYIYIFLNFSTLYAHNKSSDRLSNNENFLKDINFENYENSYYSFKDDLMTKYHINYNFDLSYMPQKILKKNTQMPQQFLWSSYVSYIPFQNTSIGSGEIQFSYSANQYWNKSFNDVYGDLKIASGINDYLNNEKQFLQLLYSHTLPNAFSFLTFNIGQYSLSFIDGTSETYNQQTGLISYSLSQNASATYPTASLGAYLEFYVYDIMVQFGFQDANNIEGEDIEFNTLKDRRFTKFLFLSWSPEVDSSFSGKYNLLFYTQPSTKYQLGDSDGFSFSFSQYFGNVLSIFGRINNSSGNITNIEESFVFGIGFKNLFKRNPNDFLGIAFGLNRINKEVITNAEYNYENVIELQYVFGIDKFLTITPDFQLFINPALNEKKNCVGVFSLRFNLVL